MAYTGNRDYLSTVLGDNPLAYWRLDDVSPSTTALEKTGTYPGSYVGLAVGTNLAPNPNLEHDTPAGAPAGWASQGIWNAVGATFTTVTTQHQAGTQSVQIVSAAGTAQGGGMVSPGSGMTSGLTYQLSVWIKGNVGGETVILFFGDAASGDYVQTSTFTLTTSFQQCTATRVATGNRASLAFAIRVLTATTTVFADTVMMAQALSLPSYLDGDTTGYTWSGTVGNSISVPSGLGATAAAGLAPDTAFAANGTTQFVTVPDAPALQLTSNFTLEAWVNPTDRLGQYAVIGKNSSTNFLMSIPTSGTLRLNANGLALGASGCESNTNVVTVGVWNHVVITFDGTNVSFYVNGTLNKVVSNSGSCTQGTNPVTLGAATQGPTIPFKGSLDEVAIYTYVLSAAQVAEHAAAGLATYTNQVLYLNGLWRAFNAKSVSFYESDDFRLAQQAFEAHQVSVAAGGAQ